MEVTPDRQAGRRTFRIQSRFGSARKWRSRKDRPCDACRRRKTACVITASPPCHFCAGKGISCQFATTPRRRRHGLESEEADDDGDEEAEGPASPSGIDSTDNRPSSPESRELTTNIQIADSACNTPQFRNDPDRGYHTSSHSLGQFSGPSPGSAFVDGGTPFTPAALRVTPLVSDSTLQRHASSGLFSPPSNAAGAEDDGSPVETLDERDNITAHTVGLSAEQDTDLLASFRSDIINERNRVDLNFVQVYSGDSKRPPVHFSMIYDEFPDYDNQAKSTASDNIEMMVGTHGDSLVRLYFRFVHPVYPILSKNRFLRDYTRDRNRVPPSLRGSVYGLAWPYWRRDSTLPSICPFSQVEMFENVHASLNRELDAPSLNTLRTCLLLLHEQPASNGTTESPRIWAQASQATACAQMIGLNRDPSDWNIHPWEKSARKRLWWATFISDTWASISHGNPPHIHPSTFTTSEISLDDMAVDEDVEVAYHELLEPEDKSFCISSGARFVETVKLTKILHALLCLSFSDRGYEGMLEQPEARERELLSIKRALSNWHSLLPQSLTMGFSKRDAAWHNNGPLQLSYYAVKALLFRALMSPVTLAAKADSTSRLRRYLPSVISEFKEFNKFMSEIDASILRAFWGRHARTNLIICGNLLIYLFLCASGPEQVAATYDLLGGFHESLQRLGGLADQTNIGLIRPAALRVDSFFAQAAEIMRSGRSGDANLRMRNADSI